MKAAVYAKMTSGKVLQIIDVDTPIPKGRRPGVDVAGEVIATGKSVAQFKPGDAVFGTCRGAFAEYACTSEAGLVSKPDNVTFEQAACAPVAGLTALQGLRDKGRLRTGQKVLINGAAGGVGTFAVQIAKSMGAEVTGVCSAGNVELVRSLGADMIIDYALEDFTRTGRHYDLLLDNVGNRTFSALRRIMDPRGRCVLAGAPKQQPAALARIAKALVRPPFLQQKFTFLIAKLRKDDLAVLRELMETGRVTPVIDRRYQLCDTADAIAYVEQGHARAKVVVNLELM